MERFEMRVGLAGRLWWESGVARLLPDALGIWEIQATYLLVLVFRYKTHPTFLEEAAHASPHQTGRIAGWCCLTLCPKRCCFENLSLDGSALKYWYISDADMLTFRNSSDMKIGKSDPMISRWRACYTGGSFAFSVRHFTDFLFQNMLKASLSWQYI